MWGEEAPGGDEKTDRRRIGRLCSKRRLQERHKGKGRMVWCLETRKGPTLWKPDGRGGRGEYLGAGRSVLLLLLLSDCSSLILSHLSLSLGGSAAASLSPFIHTAEVQQRRLSSSVQLSCGSAAAGTDGQGMSNNSLHHHPRLSCLGLHCIALPGMRWDGVWCGGEPGRDEEGSRDRWKEDDCKPHSESGPAAAMPAACRCVQVEERRVHAGGGARGGG